MPLLCVLLLATAFLLMLVAPLLLSARPWQVRFPRLALLAWFVGFVCGSGMIVTAVLITAIVSVHLSSMSDPVEAVTLTAATWLGLGAVGVVLAFIGMSIEPLMISRRVVSERLLPVVVSRQQRDGFVLVWLESDEPYAAAVPGRHPEILISTRLKTLLSAPQLRAVIAHEYAHLRSRHGWIVFIAELNARLLPGGNAAGRGLRRASLLMTELIADDAAARSAGAAHLANALVRMAQATGDPALVLRAERLTMRRWPSPRLRYHAEPTPV